MPNTEINLTTFDHEAIKDQLVQFLEQSGKFDDFNFEGSTINVINDLLARNTSLMAYMANMVANESFLQSAQIRGNVVSHAQKLSYNPRSVVSSRARINVRVRVPDTNGISANIIMPQGTVFYASYEGELYRFVTIEPYTMYLEGNEYIAEEVDIYQGQLITNRFVHIAGDSFEIPNPEIDTNTIKVLVYEDGQPVRYTQVKSVSDTMENKKLFYGFENHMKRFSIEFGKNLIGDEPETNTQVEVTYINCEANHANGASVFRAASTIDGYAGITVETVNPAFGGSEREDIESIRFIAPRQYQIQDRAVGAEDYAIKLREEYPFIRSIRSWGGEENQPPIYGRVMISIIPNNGQVIDRGIQNEMKSYLGTYKFGGITPEFVDPSEIGLRIDTEFSVDNRRTPKTFNQLFAEIQNLVEEYNDSELIRFERNYNNALVTQRAMNIRGVDSILIQPTMFATFNPVQRSNHVYSFNFGNRIVPNSLRSVGLNTSIGEQQSLYDNEGEVFITSQNRTRKVGDIDYTTGKFTLQVDALGTSPFKVYVEPVNKNVYVRNNQYIAIKEYGKPRLIDRT